MIDFEQNKALQHTKYNEPVLPQFYLPADLLTAILEANTLKAREAFYRALSKSSALELTMMKETIIFLMNEYTLEKVKEEEFNLKSVFSLKAVHTELLKRLANCKDNKEKIALLHANQWLTFFYKYNAAENLQRIMRDYALALEGRDIQRTSGAIISAFISLLAVEILGVLLVSGTINGPWLAPLMITQIPLLLLFVFSLGAKNSAEIHSRKYQDLLKEVTLPDALENAFCTAEAPTIQDAVKSLTDLISDLESYTSEVYIYRRVFTNKLNALKELDVNEYHKIHEVLNKLSVASKYANADQIVAEKFGFYVVFAIVATSLVALSIALTHTKSVGLNVFGSMLGIYLGVFSAVALYGMFEPADYPCMNKAFKQEKIEELKAINKSLEQKLSKNPTPRQDACYKPQSEGVHFQYLQPSAQSYDGCNKSLYDSPVGKYQTPVLCNNF